MKVGIIRDAFANPSDAMTFQAVEGAAMYGSQDNIGEAVLPYAQYNHIDQVPDDLDVYDVAELYHDWSAHIVDLYPERTFVTVWDNIEDFAMRVNRDITKKVVRAPVAGYIARTLRTALMLVNFYGIDPDTVYICPAAVDEDRFHISFETGHKSQSGEKLKLLYAGRLTWEKGLTRLLPALREMPNVQLIIAGSGPLDGWILEQQDAGLDIDVRGPVSHENMPELHWEADVFIYPSIPTVGWVEQFGLSAFEAVFCGRPAIVSATGAFLEYGAFFNQIAPEDIHQITEAVDVVRNGKGIHEKREYLTQVESKTVGAKLAKIYAGEGAQWNLPNSISAVEKISVPVGPM